MEDALGDDVDLVGVSVDGWCVGLEEVGCCDVGAREVGACDAVGPRGAVGRFVGRRLPLSKRRSGGVATVAAVAAVAAPVAHAMRSRAMARTVLLAPGDDDDDDVDPRSPTPRPTPSDTQTTNAAMRSNCRRVARVIMMCGVSGDA